MPWKNEEKRKEWEEKNKEERKKYKAEWHQKNKERRLKKLYEDRENKTKIFLEFKKELKCSNCGFSHPAALDFHHLDQNLKSFNVSSEIRFMSLEDLKKEISKCIVLCANCHRILHYDKKNNEDK